MNRLTIQNYFDKMRTWLRKLNSFKIRTHAHRKIPEGALHSQGLRRDLIHERVARPDANRRGLLDQFYGVTR